MLRYNVVNNAAYTHIVSSAYLNADSYSYFDLAGLGRVNFGPVPSGILTCVVILFVLLYVFFQKKGFRIAGAVFSVPAGLLSLLPALHGWQEQLSVINVIVALLLFAETAMLLIKAKQGT